MARILRIGSPAATVVIGNPGVADVTIQDPETLVLTGKSYGETNMIVLDAKGNPIADTMVDVVESQANVVTTDYSDWATNCPEYKVTAVQVSPSNGPTAWQEEYGAFARRSRRIAAE